MWQTRVRRIVTWSWKLQKTTVPNNKRMCRCSLDSRLCKVRLIGQDVMRHQMTIAQRTTSLLDKFQLIMSISCDPKVLLSFWMHICITSSANPLMHSVFYYHPATDVFLWVSENSFSDKIWKTVPYSRTGSGESQVVYMLSLFPWHMESVAVCGPHEKLCRRVVCIIQSLARYFMLWSIFM